MRIRSIHPDICIDQGLADLDNPRAERTFMRLWTYCDDDGRCLSDARLIKAAIYPRLDTMTFDEVERDIIILANAGFVVKYTDGRENYLHVPSFSKWQKPNRKIASKLPDPPSVPGSVTTHCILTEDSLHTHNNVLPVVVVGDVVGDVEGVSDRTTPKPPRPFEDDFNKCWEEYPRKESRKAALDAYIAQRRKGASREFLLTATRIFAERMTKEDRAKDKIMLGSTFFGPHDRWEDFTESPPLAWDDLSAPPPHSAFDVSEYENQKVVRLPGEIL